MTQIVALAEEKCGGLNTGAAPRRAPAHYVGGDFRAVEDLEQAHVAYAFPGLSNADPDYFVAQIYATALGGGISSRLFQEAREKRGLCYSIYAFSNGFQDSGFLGIYAGTGEKEAAEISAVIAGEMEAIAGNLTEAEVARARAQLKVSLLMGHGAARHPRRTDRRPVVRAGPGAAGGGNRRAAGRHRCRRGASAMPRG